MRTPIWNRCSAARRAALLILTFVSYLSNGTARAEDPLEFWPEINVYKKISPANRLHFVGAYAAGKDSSTASLDLAGYVDTSIKPFFRPSLLKEDWKKKRYLWTRIGYTRVAKVDVGTGTKKAPEDRAVVCLYGRSYLPSEVVVELRARTDFRWIGGEYSTRYRTRLEINRDFTIRNHTTTPYFQGELFYDTRYDGWARALWQVGAEIEHTKHFRSEPYIARQVDTLPDDEAVNVIGVVVKWYY